MKFSYHWLQELSGTKKTAPELADLLIKHSFEVESIENVESHLRAVVIGEVKTLRKHPDADRLRIAQVELGKGKKEEIVCGAPNIAEGQKVAVALPGTLLPGGRRIEEAKIRGVVSHGMICSAKEMGLGEDHAGILVLPTTSPLGVSVAEYFKLDDEVLDIKILPDRSGDALSYLGMAREITALERRKVPVKKVSQRNFSSSKNSSRVPKISIVDNTGCARYAGLSIQGVKIESSPLWLQWRLIVSGLKPINNVVDATNYLMLLSGQPMHAFDADTLEGSVRIRRAREDERLQLLNGEMKTLTAEDLVIADDKKAVALAGVMGSAGTAITEKTKSIFLEIANFDSASIRRTRIRHGLSTDASYRFERGLDPNVVGESMTEVRTLLSDISGGQILGGRELYPKPVKEWEITLSLDLVAGVLGVTIPTIEVMRSLKLLGFTVKKSGSKNLSITVPTRRRDIRDPWDLIEEIGRLYGYEKIHAPAPLVALAPVKKNTFKAFEREAKVYLAHAGFDEVMTYSFYGEEEISGALLPHDHHLELANPLSPQQKFMRLNQVPLMLRKVRENLRYIESFDIFEWGSAFGKNPENSAVEEVKSLCLLSVLPKKEKNPFFTIKGKAEAFLDALGIDKSRMTYEKPSRFPRVPVLAMLHPTRSAVLAMDGEVLGIMGEFHPQVLQAFGLEPRLAMAGFTGESLVKFRKKDITFSSLQKYPYAVRDISLTFPKSVTYQEVTEVLRQGGQPLLQKFELFDIYEHGEEKSLAFHLFFGAPERTLTSSQMDTIFDKIVAHISQKLKGRLRKE